MKKIALLAAFFLSACLSLASCAEIERQLSAQPASAQVAQRSPAPTLAGTPTVDKLVIAQVTLAAAELAMVELSAKNTDVAIAIRIGQETQAAQATETSAAKQARETERADSATQAAAGVTAQAAQAFATSTARAASTLESFQETKIAATLVILQEQVVSARAQAEAERQYMPYRAAFDAFWLPVVLVVVLIIFILAVAWLRARAEMWDNARLDSRYPVTPQAAQVETLEADDDDEPETIQTSARVEIKQGRSLNYLELPCTDEQLLLVAKGAMAGMGLTDREWVGNGFGTQTEWSAMRDELIRRGLAGWKTNAAKERGAKWTVMGLQTMGQIANTPHPTEE